MNIKRRINEEKYLTKLFRGIYIIVIILYFAAMITIVFGEELYSDYDTALYWFEELINSTVLIQNIGLFTFLILIIVNRE